MRTAGECLHKACEMERRAATLSNGERAAWLDMGRHWRRLATEAMWQDGCAATTLRAIISHSQAY